MIQKLKKHGYFNKNIRHIITALTKFQILKAQLLVLSLVKQYGIAWREIQAIMQEGGMALMLFKIISVWLKQIRIMSIKNRKASSKNQDHKKIIISQESTTSRQSQYSLYIPS